MLLPDLSTDKQSSLYKYAVEALGVLALSDEVLKVRVALSSVLKDFADALPNIVGQLARDIENKYPSQSCVIVLPDEDLLDILRAHPSWAVQAIAQRPQLSQPVSGAVINTGDGLAGLMLLENTGAEISLMTWKVIVKKKNQSRMAKPIALRKNLP